MPATLEGLRAIMEKEIDLKDDTLKIAAFGPTASISRDTSSYTGLSGEVSSTNYVAGGITLTNVTIAKDTTNEIVWMDCDDVEWTNVTFTARYLLVYDDTVSAKTSVAYYDLGSNQVLSNDRLTIQPGATSQTAILAIESE